MSTNKHPGTPLRLGRIDVQLELAIERLRSYCRHLPRGRLRLELERDSGITIGYRIERDTMTGNDYERLMTERPRRKG